MATAPSLIPLLEREAPTQIRQLRARHPRTQYVFSTARELGEREKERPGPKGEALGERRAAVVDLIRESIATVISNADNLAMAIRKRMKRVANIKLFGSIVAVISGGLASVLGYFALSDQEVAAVAALVGMLGGVAALCANYNERAPSGIRIAGVDEYGKIIEMRGNVERIRAQIDRDTLFPLTDEVLEQMLGNLDEYALNVLRLRWA